MKNKFYYVSAAFACFFSVLVGCNDDFENSFAAKQLTLPETTYNYKNISFPTSFQSDLFSNIDITGFPDPNGSQIHNIQPITDDGATLGRVLFYEKAMSINNAVACASCHLQSKAFADNKALSEGFAGKITPRNSMAIINPIFTKQFFWDSRVESANDLILEPVQNHIEMGMESIDKLTTKISKIEYYPALFEKAFGDSEVTPERISSAVSQFLTSMVSVNSRFDQGFDTNHDNFSALEKLGKAVFFSEKAKCGSCHSGGNFTAPTGFGSPYDTPEVKGTANIGLNVDYVDEGLGNGQFRIPSLRNIALTAPYMHDGRFETLMDVVDHYNEGVQKHPNLDSKFLDIYGNPVKLGLSSVEKEALVAFLGTLSDQSLVNDVKYSNPFK